MLHAVDRRLAQHHEVVERGRRRGRKRQEPLVPGGAEAIGGRQVEPQRRRGLGADVERSPGGPAGDSAIGRLQRQDVVTQDDAPALRHAQGGRGLPGAARACQGDRAAADGDEVGVQREPRALGEQQGGDRPLEPRLHGDSLCAIRRLHHDPPAPCTANVATAGMRRTAQRRSATTRAIAARQIEERLVDGEVGRADQDLCSEQRLPDHPESLRALELGRGGRERLHDATSHAVVPAMIWRMAALSLDTVVVRRAEPLTAAVDDELVMLDPRQSRYFGLDAIGHRIWELLEGPRSVDALCSALQDEFEVTAEACRADVLAFLQDLTDAELVEIR